MTTPAAHGGKARHEGPDSDETIARSIIDQLSSKSSSQRKLILEQIQRVLDGNLEDVGDLQRQLSDVQRQLNIAQQTLETTEAARALLRFLKQHSSLTPDSYSSVTKMIQVLFRQEELAEAEPTLELEKLWDSIKPR